MTVLKTRCDLAVNEPEQLVSRFCDHFAEHGQVRRRGRAGRLTGPYGSVWIHAAENAFRVRARAVDETFLTYLKMGVVSHLKEFVGDAAPPVSWTGDGQSGGTPSFWRTVRVVSAFDLTPAMRRVVLEGSELQRFATDGLHVRLFFPPNGRELLEPVLGSDGCPVWPSGDNALTARVYTIRQIEPERGLVTIDILRHDGDDTPGSSFAVSSRPGDAVGMAGPLGGEGVPPFRRLFFFGDETAIPAIDRIFKLLAPDVQAQAVIEIAGPAEEQPLASVADVQVRWLHRNAGTSLADAAGELLGRTLGADSFVWAGCEHTDFVAIRRLCRKTLNLGRHQHLVAPYWRKGSVGS